MLPLCQRGKHRDNDRCYPPLQRGKHRDNDRCYPPLTKGERGGFAGKKFPLYNMIKLHSLAAGYKNKPVLSDISFSVKAGDCLGIIGPNGSGKTTLFRTITRTLKPWSGSVLYNNADLYQTPRHTIATTMAAMPQFIEYPFGITVYDFVALGRYPHLKRFAPLDAHDIAIIDRCLESTDSTSVRSRNLQELSGGERQRVLLAQALAQEPTLLILDEPTAHLDIGHQAAMMDLVQTLNAQTGLTVIMILHDLNLAAEYCRSLVLLHQGSIFAQGAPAKVLTYQNIEQVYNTVVVVNSNPVTQQPNVILVPQRYLTAKTASEREIR